MESLIYQMEHLDLHVPPPPPKKLTRPQLENVVDILYKKNISKQFQILLTFISFNY